MSKDLLQINISNLKYVDRKKSLIKINIDNDDFVHANFPKIVSYSKYI